MLVGISKNGQEMEGDNFKLLKHIFKHHDDQEKVKDLEKILIDVHP